MKAAIGGKKQAKFNNNKKKKTCLQRKADFKQFYSWPPFAKIASLSISIKENIENASCQRL